MNVNTKQENKEGLRNKLLLLLPLLLQITIITDLNKNTKWKLITKMNKVITSRLTQYWNKEIKAGI